MRSIARPPLPRSFVIAATAIMLGACADDAPVAPNRSAATEAHLAASSAYDVDAAIVTARKATARYHDLNAALSDGFVFLHECENRPDEGPVGTVYVHMGRLTDGAIDPALPDALIYEPRAKGPPALVGIEFAVPYALWTEDAPPSYLGHEFEREDEFGVFGLHMWIWRRNPAGLFAESNPRVSCEAVE